VANILTVDDSPSIRQMIKVTLAPAGHNVIEAGGTLVVKPVSLKGSGKIHE